jgi:2-dehydro-3-deoxyphosphogluconate aldolase/(4S)-4-hydroxy-2-oxoglutarate aldolase
VILNTFNQIEGASTWIRRSGIIGILRGDFSTDDLIRIGDALLAGTVTTMEVTLNTPSALEALPRLRTRFGNDMLIGAGTVRDADQARQAKEAGAQFLVSPNLDLESVRYAQTSDILHIPGIFTATEAQTAYAAGCQIVKLFPMETTGPAYLKALRAPLDNIDFIPTGGVSLENIGEYARAGAVAVGLGSKLIANRKQESDPIIEHARALRAAWEAGKHG